MLDKQMIPHLKGLDVGVKICQEQLCSSIREDHATFLVKNTLFKEEVACQPLKELESCPPIVNSKWLCRGRHLFFPHKRPESSRNSFSLADRLTIHGSDLMPVGKRDVFRDRAILSPL